MRKLLVVAAFVVAALIPMSAAAQVEQSPIGGPGSHTHFVVTGNDGCVAIDTVAFEGTGRGLHQGASRSGADQGPEHGAC